MLIFFFGKWFWGKVGVYYKGDEFLGKVILCL